MKLRNQLLVAAFAILASAPSLFAQNSSSANGYSAGNILSPISVGNYHELAFGTLIPTTSAGTAVIGVTGLNVSSVALIAETPTVTNVVAYNAQNALNSWSTPGPAIFEVDGALNFTFAISLPSNAVPVHLVNHDVSAPDMTVDNFTCVVGSPGVVGTTGTLSHGIGVEHFAVGGKLHVPANATRGAYSGSFTVAVNYN